MQVAEIAKKCRFLVLVTLTFELDLQTDLSEGPSTSSVWIWCKSIQWFHTQTKNTDWRCQKTTFRSSLHVV